MRLYYTSGYYPEVDSHTKRVNQTLEQYLQIYCNYQQSDWSRLLPLAKFAYNSAPSTTTDLLLFFTKKSYLSRLQIQTGLEPTPKATRSFMIELVTVHEKLKKNIARAQAHYQPFVDAKRKPASNIQVGDSVFVLAKFIYTM